MTSTVFYQDLLARLAVDLVAMVVLIGVLFFRIHRRIDLVAVYIACNVGLFSVLTVLATSQLSSAIGFGLFGVLSIIRLRSSEYDHIQISYFFMALATALVTAIDTHPIELSMVLVALLTVTMAVVDSNKLRHDAQDVLLTLDRVFNNAQDLHAHIEIVVGGRVISAKLRQVNYVAETTQVVVVFRPNIPTG